MDRGGRLFSLEGGFFGGPFFKPRLFSAQIGLKGEFPRGFLPQGVWGFFPLWRPQKGLAPPPGEGGLPPVFGPKGPFLKFGLKIPKWLGDLDWPPQPLNHFPGQDLEVF